MLRFRCPSCQKILVLEGAQDAEEIFTCPGCQKPCRLPRSVRSQPPSEARVAPEEEVLDVVAADSIQQSSATRTHQRDETAEADVVDVVVPLNEEDSRARRRDDRDEDYDDRRSRRRDDYDEEREDRRARRRDDYDDHDERRSRRRRDEDYDDYDDRRPRRRREEEYDDLEEVEDEEEKQSKLTVTDRMLRVHLGLGFHYAKLLCTFISIALSTIAIALPPLMLFSQALNLIAPILGLVGSLICCQAPKKSKSRGQIWASFILDLISAALILIGFISALSGAIRLGGILGLIGQLVSLAAFVLFMLFLSKLAIYLRDKVQADEAITILFKWVVLVLLVTIPLSLFIVSWGRSAVLFWIGVFLLVAWAAMYLSVLLQLFQLIGSLRSRIAIRF